MLSAEFDVLNGRDSRVLQNKLINPIVKVTNSVYWLSIMFGRHSFYEIGSNLIELE